MTNTTCLPIDYTDDFYDNTNVFLRNFFIFTGVFISGSAIAIAVSARLLFKEIKKEYNNLYGYDSDDEEYFDSKYLKEYLEMSSDKEESKSKLDDLKNKVVSEYSPNGLVILGYDNDKQSFYYYSDSKNIDYSYLEVIARKFVVTNNCKDILINSREEFYKALNKEVKKQSSPEEESTNNVFANLKTTEKTKITVDNNLKIKDKEIPIPENSNKYIYKGKLDDYTNKITNEESKPKSEQDEFENIDYEKFKKQA